MVCYQKCNSPPGMRMQQIRICRRQRAQVGIIQSAPLFFTTPFFELRYRNISELEERCRCYCQEIVHFICLPIENNKFGILDKLTTAFLSRIRGPPHLEIHKAIFNIKEAFYVDSKRW